MPITIDLPKEEIDRSQASEDELNQKAKIAAQLAGFNSLREFEMAAKKALVEAHYPIKSGNGKKS